MVDIGIVRFLCDTYSGALIESLDADKLDQSVLAAWTDRSRMKWDLKGLSRLIQLLELGSKRKRCTKLKMRIFQKRFEVSVACNQVSLLFEGNQSIDAHSD